MTDDIDKKFAEFDKLGEQEVRKRLAQGVYGDKNSRLVATWLDKLSRESQEASKAASEAKTAEQLAIQREQLVAAKQQAANATIQANNARLAVRISIGTAIVTGITCIINFAINWDKIKTYFGS
jgi:L-fucose isomerase-like protein